MAKIIKSKKEDPGGGNSGQVTPKLKFWIRHMAGKMVLKKNLIKLLINPVFVLDLETLQNICMVLTII